MEKFYITSDKVGDFIQRMYEKGIKVEADPKNNQLCVTKSKGGYEWVKVFHKDTYENLCKAFDEQEGRKAAEAAESVTDNGEDND